MSLAALAALAALATPPSQAQQPPPDAGRLLEQSRPATPQAPPPASAGRLVQPPLRPTVDMPDGVTVVPSAFRISGAVSFGDAVLQDLIKPWVGQRLGLKGLNEAAGALTRHYQNAGHFLSYAYLPAQRVDDGVIEIAVLEGRLDAVQAVTAQEVRLRESVVQAHTDGLSTRQPVLQADVERQMLLLNDLPGVSARAAATPGSSQGGADLVVTLAEEEPLEVRLEADNHGSRSTGNLRAGVAVQLRDVFGFGDVIHARGLAARQGGLVSGTLGATVPLGGDGWKFGATLSRLQYELGAELTRLGAVGSADAVEAKLQYPLLRSLHRNVRMEAVAEHKRLRDQTLQVNDATLGTDRQRRSRSVAGGISLDQRDGWLGGGGLVAGLKGTIGTLSSSTGAPATPASWMKLGWNLLRQQNLAGPWTLNLRAHGQIARQNLDSGEKFGLAGPYTVRAYAPGEAVVDEGAFASLELRWQHDFQGGQFGAGFFHERASGRITLNPLAAAAGAGNEPQLAGTGLALQWSRGDMGVTASLAWRGSRVPSAEGGDGRPRLYLNLFLVP